MSEPSSLTFSRNGRGIGRVMHFWYQMMAETVVTFGGIRRKRAWYS